MNRVKQLLKNVLWLMIVIALVLVGGLLAELIGPLKALDAFLAPSRAWWAALTMGMTVVGLLLLAFTQFVVRPPTEAELEEVTRLGVKATFSSLTRPEIEEMRASRFIQMAAPIAVWRRALYRFLGPVAGSAFDVEAPMSVVKTAFRSGAWRRNPIWQRLTLMGIGGILMVFGLFTLPIVLESGPFVKLVCGGALLYATVRTVWAFQRA
ncbi:MAG: hypothetical protein HY332_11280 [Chloroflexi bacterium]|nr:hypothetical protein [Chloroflexota bacterium]